MATKVKCSPCEGQTEALPVANVEATLSADAQLAPMWKVETSDEAPKLVRTFVCKNFKAAMDFLNEAATIAEDEGHHPDLHLTSYRNVEVKLYTHSVSGLTENDLILARRLSSVPVDYSPKFLNENPDLNPTAASTSEKALYEQDGPIAKEIAAVTPYYPFKTIPRFYDIGGFLAHPGVFQKVIDAYVQRFKGMDIDSIGGFDARGFVLGPPIALALKKPFFMLRKPGKMPNTISSRAYNVEYGEREGMCISRNSVQNGDRVLLIDDLVATGGTLSSGIELVQHMGGEVVECACVVELKMFIDPPAESGLPSRKKMFEEKGIGGVPVWGLVSEDVLTLEAELPEGYKDDGEEHK